MQYMLLIYGQEIPAADCVSSDMNQVMAAYMAYTHALKAAGALLGSNALQHTGTATTVRGSKVADGPYAETKEQLGGYFLLDVPDLDAALEWAKRCPGAQYGGAVEVRPVMVFSAEDMARAQDQAKAYA
jgi:hypothetical protein